MWILLLPLIIAEVAFWLFLAYAVWRAFNAFRQSSWPALALWLAIIALPFGLFFAQHTLASMRETQRASEVAGFTRQAMPQSYPRRLEIHGYMTTWELIMFLDALEIDDIVMIQSRAHRGFQKAQFITLAEDCRGRGRPYLAALSGKGQRSATKDADESCLQKQQGKIDADRRNQPAILFLMGSASTLKLPGTTWSGGNYEARLRTAEGDVLLDYWERPYIERPGGPSPWAHAFKANTDWKSYRNPGRPVFFARAAGLTNERGGGAGR